MDLKNQYKRQFDWRDWSTALSHVPLMQGQLVLDLGCAIGDLSLELSARGASVIGIDGNIELLEVARKRNIPNTEFRLGELANLEDLNQKTDGIWCSFAAAYFINFGEVLKQWAKYLRTGGWIALTEIDDLFGHEPLSESTRMLLHAFADEARLGNRYDFHSGSKLRLNIESSGFRVKNEMILKDKEFSFEGPANSEILHAWRLRFERMKGLQSFAGSKFKDLETEFLTCLSSQNHKSNSKVYCIIAEVIREN